MTSRLPKHLCHAMGCGKSVPPKYLMCAAHWRRCPRHLQDEVWATYQPGQEISKTPTHAYLVASERAICAVAVADGMLTEEDATDRIANLRRLLGI